MKARVIHQLRDRHDLERVRQEDRNFVGTLAKGMMILQCFISDPRPHANSELAERLGMSRPTVSRLCRSLLELGFLDHDPRLDRYFIGPAAVAIAYPYVIKTPVVSELQPAMQALATRFEGAVSVGVAMDLDVVYLDSAKYEQGTLARPGVGAVRDIVECAIGRAWLAGLAAPEREQFMARVRQQRPQAFARCAERARESVEHYAARGFAVNLGDAGLGVLAVGVASRIPYGSRQLLFNCAVSGHRARPKDLLSTIGPALVEFVERANRRVGRPRS